jgi:hypothetical protein
MTSPLSLVPAPLSPQAPLSPVADPCIGGGPAPVTETPTRKGEHRKVPWTGCNDL